MNMTDPKRASPAYSCAIPALALALLVYVPVATAVDPPDLLQVEILLEEDFEATIDWDLWGWDLTTCRSSSPSTSITPSAAPCTTTDHSGFTHTKSPHVSIPAGATDVLLSWRTWGTPSLDPNVVWEVDVVDTSNYYGYDVWSSRNVGGGTNSWTTVTADLSGFKGKTIYLQFSQNAYSGAVFSGEGWYIDDVLLVARPGISLAPPAQNNPMQDRELLKLEEFVLTPSTPLPTEGTETPDYPGTPGQPTPPVGQHVGDVSVRDVGADVCVDFMPEGSGAIEIVCLNRALLGPVSPLVPRGDVGLLVVDPDDVPPTQPVAVPDVPGSPVGSIPETSITVRVHYHYDPAHVTRLVGVGGDLVELYSPVGPDVAELDWLASNADYANLEIEVTLYRDGAPEGSVVHSIPALGQALAAAETTAGTLNL